ncbi:hypothetical protein [Fodinicola feengrottensis]|uniref:hypothetical protein n=1 Tax=Fodinicola feengrottensis TaxID=435914 RepID=UPI0013D5AB78|nr:hypothetical protein [Fodinicola feengrottensis]
MTAPHSPDRDDETQPKPSIKARLDLSFTQVIAGALAAVTSAVAASYFGVAGTLIGAGFGSVIITVGTSVYKASLRRTNETLRKVIPVQAISQLRVVPDDTTVVRSGGPEPTTDPARLGPPPPRPPRPSTVPGAGAARPADETTLMKKVSDSTIGFGQGGRGHRPAAPHRRADSGNCPRRGFRPGATVDSSGRIGSRPMVGLVAPAALGPGSPCWRRWCSRWALG